MHVSLVENIIFVSSRRTVVSTKRRGKRSSRHSNHTDAQRRKLFLRMNSCGLSKVSGDCLAKSMVATTSSFTTSDGCNFLWLHVCVCVCVCVIYDFELSEVNEIGCFLFLFLCFFLIVKGIAG